VFHRPASEFVMNFLGNVNVFQGRVEGDRAVFGSLEGPSDCYHGSGKSARVFVRPYDLDSATQTNGHTYFKATIRHINAAGQVVKVVLVNETGDSVYVELPQERYRGLHVMTGSTVYVTPREVKVFVDDYSI